MTEREDTKTLNGLQSHKGKPTWTEYEKEVVIQKDTSSYNEKPECMDAYLGKQAGTLLRGDITHLHFGNSHHT